MGLCLRRIWNDFHFTIEQPTMEEAEKNGTMGYYFVTIKQQRFGMRKQSLEDIEGWVHEFTEATLHLMFVDTTVIILRDIASSLRHILTALTTKSRMLGGKRITPDQFWSYYIEGCDDI